MEYTFCLFSPPEHTLVYVFLFTPKYTGSVLSKRKYERFFKKSDFMLRKVGIYRGASFNYAIIACILFLEAMLYL